MPNPAPSRRPRALTSPIRSAQREEREIPVATRPVSDDTVRMRRAPHDPAEAGGCTMVVRYMEEGAEEL